jgi:hypothetical protein
MSHDDIRKIVRDELIKMFASLTTEPTTPNRWVALKDAVVPLGYPSYSALHKDVSAGVFRMGDEIRDRRKPGAKIARLQINLQQAQKRLSEDPSIRRGV